MQILENLYFRGKKLSPITMNDEFFNLLQKLSDVNVIKDGLSSFYSESSVILPIPNFYHYFP